MLFAVKFNFIWGCIAADHIFNVIIDDQKAQNANVPVISGVVAIRAAGSTPCRNRI